MIYLTVALFVAFLVSGILAVDYRKKMIHFHAESRRERSRANAWQGYCSDRDQRIHTLGEANQATNEPGFHKFSIDEEPIEPAEVVEFHTVPRFEVNRDDVDSSEQNFI